MSCKVKCISRKPVVWSVFAGDRPATLRHHPTNPRPKRWQLFLAEGDLWFKSKRAALYFHETGEKFVTNPVFDVINGRRGTKRIR